jgi:hypothetical protein
MDINGVVTSSSRIATRSSAAPGTAVGVQNSAYSAAPTLRSIATTSRLFVVEYFFNGDMVMAYFRGVLPSLQGYG